jgi:predicted TIM-barrel fold metal-dependent hydrolase
MSATAEDLASIPIIDIDTHFTEPADLWTSRAAAKHKGMVLETRTNKNGLESWHIGDEFVATCGLGVIDRNEAKQKGTATLPRLDLMSPAQYDPAARVRMMDRFGVIAALQYPNVVGFGAVKLMKLKDDAELRLFHVQAYNDAMAEFQKGGEGRLFPQAVLPLWDLDETLRELRRVREDLGLTGIAMSDRPDLFGQPPLADPAWDPFWATCQDFRLPINFHVASGGAGSVETEYWGKAQKLGEGDFRNDPATVCFTSMSIFIMNFRDIVNLILTGVLDRFPQLKFVSVESGVGWIPFIIQGLEYTMDELLTREDRRRYKRSPREMFKDQIYASYWFEGANNVDNYISEFGADNLMFETDYPHPQCLYPDVREKVEETLGKYDLAIQRKVLFENAAKLYGIEVQ